MARAVLQKRRIMCLDEASSALDMQSDEIIRQTVRKAFEREVTMIAVAHRIATVIDCDRISRSLFFARMHDTNANDQSLWTVGKSSSMALLLN